MSLLRTPLKLPLALFLISAGIGVWASYDASISRDKFILILGAVALYFVIANLGAARSAAAWGALLLCAAFSAYFVTQHDFGAEPGKLRIISTIGELLNRGVPQLGYHVPHPNIAAAALELGLPIGFALGWQRLYERKWLQFGLAVGLTAPIGFGLFMTSSRGAALAIGLVALSATFIYATRKLFSRFNVPNRLWAPMLFNAALVGLLWVIYFLDPGKLVESIGAISAGGGSVSRLQVYGQASHLIQDYVFTGSGLGVFPMVFSTYALFIDVPFLPHSHNLFLQIWIEQGLLGIVTFGWVILGFYYWVWRRREWLNWLTLGGLVASTILLVHGLFDVLLYSSRFLPLIFVPMGLTVASLRHRRLKEQRWNPANHKFAVGAALGLLAAGVSLLLVARDPIMAQWYENLGSVEQTRAELTHYHFMDSLVEFVRRDVDLSLAESYLHQSLALDADNVSANQRLASIALARGQYARALDYAQAAESRDPRNAITRELLGEAYLGVGQLENAYEYWSSVSDAASRLERLSQQRYQRNGDKQRAVWALALASRIRSQ